MQLGGAGLCVHRASGSAVEKFECVFTCSGAEEPFTIHCLGCYEDYQAAVLLGVRLAGNYLESRIKVGRYGDEGGGFVISTFFRPKPYEWMEFRRVSKKPEVLENILRGFRHGYLLAGVPPDKGPVIEMPVDQAA